MRALGDEEADAAFVVILAEMGLKIGGGSVLGFGELGAPFHEEAVGEAAHEGEDEHDVGMADPTAIVVVGDVEALVKSGFDAPGLAVELEPAGGIELVGFETGDEADLLGFVALDVAA